MTVTVSVTLAVTITMRVIVTLAILLTGAVIVIVIIIRNKVHISVKEQDDLCALNHIALKFNRLADTYVSLYFYV